LKTLPMEHPEIENASFEFDRKSLRPTYRLQVGIPGASYAVEIAERLGMPTDITDRAAGLLGKGERSLSDLIESLETELATLRKDKKILEEKLANASQLEEFYKSQTEKLKNEIDRTKQEQLKEIENILAECRIETEKLVKDIRESQASKDSVKATHKYLQQSNNKLGQLRKKHLPKSDSSDTIQPGDTVLVVSLQKEGELAEPPRDDKAKVRIGNIMITVDLEDIRKLSREQSGRNQSAGISSMRDTEMTGPEIQLLGMTVEEASEALDKFLDSAVLTGLKQIYVVHGKGTGALRKAMTALLQKHPAVESVRLGNWNEGGAGVSVVKMK
jgi:DNA mismatch repair protein MutS2